MQLKRSYCHGLLVSLCFVVCSVIYTPPAFSKTTELQHLKVEELSNKVRFSIQLKNASNFHSFSLGSPPRFVIDFRNAQVSGDLSFPLTQRNPVKQIRVAEKQDGKLRLVFDLKDQPPVKAYLSNSDKNKSQELIIDFLTPYFKAKTAEAMPSLPKRDIVIVIDPGHGGKDPGASGPRGTHEKDVVLSISKKLQALINEQPGFRAVLTRNTDVYLTLRSRLAIARKYKADMFIAIHADAYQNRDAEGASVFALSQRGATSEAARWLAKKENESELMGGLDLSDKGNVLKSVLLNLSQTATIRASLTIGDELISSLRKMAQLHHRKVEQAAFVVLKSPDIPSLLVETGFLSNRTEEQHLRDSSYQLKLANAIKHGIYAYFEASPPRNTWVAYWRDHSNSRKT